jgi:hypothetical protein
MQYIIVEALKDEDFKWSNDVIRKMLDASGIAERYKRLWRVVEIGSYLVVFLFDITGHL